MNPSKAKKKPLFFSIIFFLLASVLISACTTMNTKDNAKRRSQSNVEKGYIEFYCMRCMTGWAVFEKKGAKQVSLAQKILGRRVEDSFEMPSREKKVRITLPVGPHQITIRLLPYTLVDRRFDVKDGSSKEVRIMVDRNRLTPVRLDFVRVHHDSFSWNIKQGDPIPLNENADAIETHTVFLNSSDWDSRWYATRFFAQMKGEVPELALARLGKLSGWEALQKCLKKSTIIECESLREEAATVLRKIVKK